MIERIISTGQATPPGEWYDQNRDEWVILLQGEASLAYADGSKIKLTAGDYVFIPAHQHGDWAWSGNPTAPHHQKHPVEHTTSKPPCIWLAVDANLEN